MNRVVDDEVVLDLGRVPQLGRHKPGRVAHEPVERLEKKRYFRRRIDRGGAHFGVAMTEGGDAYIEENGAGFDEPQPSVDILAGPNTFGKPSDLSQDFLFHDYRRGVNRARLQAESAILADSEEH